MAFLFDFLVTKGALKSLPYIRHFVDLQEKLSANEILRRVNAAGMAVRRKTGLEIIRRLQAQELVKPYIKSVNLNKLFNPHRLARTMSDTPRNFTYVINLTGTHPDTGEHVTSHFTVSSNDMLTKQEAIDRLLSFPALTPTSKTLIGQQVHVDNVLIGRNSPLIA